MFRLVVMLMATCSVSAVSDFRRYNFSEVRTVDKTDSDKFLDQELTSVYQAHKQEELEKQLREAFISLPKDGKGRLSDQTTFYALMRVFTQRHGWFIKGLEPESFTKRNAIAGDNATLKAWMNGWVPKYLLDRLKDSRSSAHRDGISLHELVALAATLEDLIQVESDERLAAIYKALGLDVSAAIPQEQLERVMDTYMYVLSTRGNIRYNSTAHLDYKRGRYFTIKYKEYPKLSAWLRGIENPHVVGTDASANGIRFATTSAVASTVSKEFAAFNQDNCLDMKALFIDLEARSGKLGRVRLPDFYNASLCTRWKLNENVDYLRALGALDESNPKVTYVISANYINARPNCLEASSVHAVCCRNECEDLVKQLEGTIAAPMADADWLARLVAQLPSATVDAPREMPPMLLERLQQVATLNGGQVNLHGRLFAQWMHHAYPRECPYPHERNTISPQDPSEWLQGAGGVSHTLSDEELQALIASDECPAGGPCDHDGDVELPWTSVEELYAEDPKLAALHGTSQVWLLLRVPVFVLMLLLVGVVVFTSTRKSKGSKISARHALPLAIFAVISGACLAWFDPVIFIFVVCGIAIQQLLTSAGTRCVQGMPAKVKIDCEDDASM